MRTPRPVMAAYALLAICLLLAAGACATPPVQGSAASGSGDAGTSGSDLGAPTSPFGSMYRFGSGLEVIVSEPTSFQPSQSAYPPSESAVAFEITVRNESDHRYRLTNMSVTVIADQQDAKQLTDPTQGYTGLMSTPKGLPTDCEKRISLAFAVPAKPTHLKLVLSPHKGEATHVTYVGSMDGATPSKAR